MKSKIILCAVLLITALHSCDRAKQSAKETITKTGETIGQSTTEFVGGVTEGVNKAMNSQVVISDNLKNQGLETGKFKLNADSGVPEPHILSVYLIFNQELNDTLQVRVTDSKGSEYGRAKQAISGRKGEAKYVDFIFDARTEIESRSKFIIE